MSNEDKKKYGQKLTELNNLLVETIEKAEVAFTNELYKQKEKSEFSDISVNWFTHNPSYKLLLVFCFLLLYNLYSA